jgi:hypothetical protein
METRIYMVKIVFRTKENGLANKSNIDLPVTFEVKSNVGDNIIEKIDEKITESYNFIDMKISYTITEIKEASLCWGCRYEQGNQTGHMEPPHGCLYKSSSKSSSDKSSPEEPFKPKGKNWRSKAINGDDVEEIDDEDNNEDKYPKNVFRSKDVDQLRRDQETRDRAKKRQAIYDEAKLNFQVSTKNTNNNDSSSSSDLLI